MNCKEIVEQLKKRYDKRCEKMKRKVKLPILGVEVWVYPETAECTCAIADSSNELEILVTMIVFLCHNEKGQKLFTRNEAKAMLKYLKAEELNEIAAPILNKKITAENDEVKEVKPRVKRTYKKRIK